MLRWRYVQPSGNVRHYVNVKDGRAACGLWPDTRVTPWYGNNNKLEVGIVLKLPACKHCIEAVSQ